MEITKSNIKSCWFGANVNMSIRQADEGDGIYLNAENVAFVETDEWQLLIDLENDVRDYLADPTKGLDAIIQRLETRDKDNLATYPNFAGRTLEGGGMHVDFLFPEDSPILEEK